MIGVISSEREEEIVKEFFELFKTPWEFYAHDRYYDIVLLTQNKIPKPNSKLVVIYGSDKSQFDHVEEIRVQSKYKRTSVEYNGVEIPIYGNLLTFKGEGQPILRVRDSSEVAGLKIDSSRINMIVLGYNLFDEIYYLLSTGQPKENSFIPTLEIHISLLRNLITNAGIPLIEVPPVPIGYDFITCLTHDIDFVGICNHRLDHTMLGFLYRASVGSMLRVLKGKLSLQKLITNWKAVLSLPFVYLGLAKDFWFQFNEYTKIEKDMKSTFFLSPFKDQMGENISMHGGKRRAIKYDISDVGNTAKTLAEKGFEIGTHGIDAWHSLEKARRELDRVVEYCRGPEIGIRIHWLLFNNDSYQILENAGFSYDSTSGYNDAVGYRAGTLQVFKPFSTKNLMELPLHIQDTALFYPRRMNLSEKKALNLCVDLFKNAKSYGGVLTILWHDRSLAPERLWGDFYINLLKKVKEDNAWLAPAGQVVRWFRNRRALTFDEVKIVENKIRLTLKHQENYDETGMKPFLLLRIHPPRIQDSGSNGPTHSGNCYFDVPLKGEGVMEISF